MTTSEAQTIMELFSMRLQLLLDRNQITQAEPVSYTHLDVYKRQPINP